jgi:hypothetical protein
MTSGHTDSSPREFFAFEEGKRVHLSESVHRREIQRDNFKKLDRLIIIVVVIDFISIVVFRSFYPLRAAVVWLTTRRLVKRPDLRQYCDHEVEQP